MGMHVRSQSSERGCPLCRSDGTQDHCRDTRRDFLRCGACGLVFVPASQHLHPDAEKKRYDLHRNDPRDQGYRAFLGRLAAPVLRSVARGGTGLDFGSGPVPVLAGMFEEAGHVMAVYDPFYAPDPAALDRQYDFITAAEVVEHLRNPRAELGRLWSCLRPGGTLGIMTRTVVPRTEFGRWQYKNDLTHICFFSPATFQWLARWWSADPSFPDADIALFHKRPAGNAQEGRP